MAADRGIGAANLAKAHGDDVEGKEVPVDPLAARRVATRVLVPFSSLLDGLSTADTLVK